MGTHCTKVTEESKDNPEGKKSESRENLPSSRAEKWKETQGEEQLFSFMKSEELNDMLSRGVNLRDVLLKLHFKDMNEVNNISKKLLKSLSMATEGGSLERNIYLDNEKANSYIIESKDNLLKDLVTFFDYNMKEIRNLSLPIIIIETLTQLYQLDLLCKRKEKGVLIEEWWSMLEGYPKSPLEYFFTKLEELKKLLRAEILYRLPVGPEEESRALVVEKRNYTENSAFSSTTNQTQSTKASSMGSTNYAFLLDKSHSKTRNSFTESKPLLFHPAYNSGENHNNNSLSIDKAKGTEGKALGKSLKITNRSPTSGQINTQNHVIREVIEEDDIHEEEGARNSYESYFIVKSSSGKKTSNSEEDLEPFLYKKKK